MFERQHTDNYQVWNARRCKRLLCYRGRSAVRMAGFRGGCLKAAAERLKTMSRPFLNWAGKPERLSFGVPTLSLVVHERLPTKAIIETIK